MSNSLTTKISRDNTISLPEHTCQKLHVNAGDHLLLDGQDNLLILLPQPADLVNHMAGLHREIWQDVDTAAYLNEESEAWHTSDYS